MRFVFFSSRRRHTRLQGDWSSDVCSSDLYIVEMVLGGFFHIQVPAINGSGAVGIGFSLFVVVIAALNLVLDFDMIETGVRNGAPKYMAWYGSFGPMLTLIWSNLEILRLLAKARPTSRNP